MNDFSQCPTQGIVGLLSLVINTGRHAEARVDEALAAVGLTFTKWRALETLLRADAPIPLKHLPEQLGCVKSNITQLVDRLEADGLLRRVPDPDDRRGTRAELTDAGRAAQAAGQTALDSAIQSLFAALSDDQQSDLRAALHRLQGK